MWSIGLYLRFILIVGIDMGYFYLLQMATFSMAALIALTESKGAATPFWVLFTSVDGLFGVVLDIVASFPFIVPFGLAPPSSVPPCLL